MDPNERDEDREVSEQSRSFEVARTDQGWGVWDRRQLPDGPLAMYPPSDEGFESAYRHFTRLNRGARRRMMRAISMRISLWIALAAGVTWIVMTSIVQVRMNLMEVPFESVDAYVSVRWADVLGGIAQPVFFVAFATFVMSWLRGHEVTLHEASNHS